MTALDYLTIIMLVLTTVAVLTSLVILAPVFWTDWKHRRAIKHAKAQKASDTTIAKAIHAPKKRKRRS